MSERYEEYIVAGQSIERIGGEVRAPLGILTRVCPNGCGVAVLAHRTSDDNHWFSRRFRSFAQAEEYLAAIKSDFPHGLSTKEFITRSRGGRCKVVAAGL